MMSFLCLLFFFFACVCHSSSLFSEAEDLFRDLATVHEIEKKAEDRLPLFYNQSFVGGYFLTPSARMEKEGMVALGGGPIPPYNIYGGAVQLLKRFELSANYRTFKGGITKWIRDDSERIVNAKLNLLRPSDVCEWMPILSIGGDVVISSKSKNSQYAIVTKEFLDAHLELSLGVGRKRLKGLFGGASWSPLRKTTLPLLKDLSLLAEYDPTDYRRDFAKQSKERKVRSRLNVGIGFLGWDVLQLSAMTIRGKELAALASIRYPLGTTMGLLPKVNNPKLYIEEKGEEMDAAFAQQNLTLYSAFLFYDAVGAAPPGKKSPRGKVDSRDLFCRPASPTPWKGLAASGSSNLPTLNFSRGNFLSGAVAVGAAPPGKKSPRGKVDSRDLFCRPASPTPWKGLAASGSSNLPTLNFSRGNFLSGAKTLWLKVINNTYREEQEVRVRLSYLLSELVPKDVSVVFVVIEADGVPAYSYRFRKQDLERFRLRKMDAYALELISPMKEPTTPPSDAHRFFQRKKPLAQFMLRPRVLTYFIGEEGNFNYNIGALARVEGYLFDKAFYGLSLSYAIHSSDPSSLSSKSDLTPRALPEVRTDALRYHETANFSLEEAYLQKGWHLGSGWYGRLSGGYFEPAYVGGNAEVLFSPITSSWAFGIEGAIVFKRRYEGLGLFHHVRQIKNKQITHTSFLGKQVFFNAHYYYIPVQLGFLVKTGRFLAKDFGSRFEVTRTFKSGFRFSIWYTLSGKKWGQYFHDRGFAFSIPLDFFLKKSSRSHLGYGIAATLRNNGAFSATGKGLYNTLAEERR